MYWWYYQNNRWKFINRSNTVNFVNTDMQTWTLDYLVFKITDAYRNALANKEGLQKVPVTDYKELIVLGSKPREIRPTLYDFLAHKAIDFYSSSEITLTKPADNFELKEDFYFLPAEEFASKNIRSGDTLSLHYQAILILQDLLKFRLQNPNEDYALIDLEIKRLTFVYANSVHNNKESLYLTALQNLEKQFSESPYCGEIKLEIARYYQNLSSKYSALNPSTEKYKSYKTIAFQLAKDIIATYPNSYAADHALTIIDGLESHNLDFTVETIIPYGINFSARINWTNLNFTIRFWKIR
jgi:hypothetical protein